MTENKLKKVNTVSTTSPTVEVPTPQKTEKVEKRIKKECFGCLDNFTCSQSQNYDYCKNCELNGSRYIPGRKTKNNCPECSDGSGIIKFPHQPPRACKLCSLTNQTIKEQNIFTKNA